MDFESFKEIQVLAELNFPVACNGISISKDKNRLLVVGVYPPSVKLFDLKSGILKFERHLVSDPLKIISLEEDAEKFSILRNDKTIEFHTRNGYYEKVKTPNQPKDMILNTSTSELYLGGNYDEIYRFNLEQGRFLKSIGIAGNRLSWSDKHGLLCAISKKSLNFIDTRSKDIVYIKTYENELISIAQDESGEKYALGDDSGNLIEYDFRGENPIKSISFENSFPQKIQFSGNSLITAENTNIWIIPEKVNDLNDSTKLNMTFHISDFSVDRGLIIVGGENQSIKTIVSKELGEIPSWIR